MSEHRHPRWATVLAALQAAVAWSAALEAFAGIDVSWQERYYNPEPAAGDFILPMPCGGAITFRKVEVPGGERWMNDRAIELGQNDDKSGFKEGRRRSYIAGAFTDADNPYHRYYYIAKYETTKDQYATLGENCPKPSIEGRLPAVNVSWFEAVDFGRRYTEWLLQHHRDRLPGEGNEPGFVRLPTEVEWEFAARGGIMVDTTQFLANTFPMPEGGLTHYAWHQSTQSAQDLNPVGLLKPNPLGLHDVLGNAAEMVLAPFYLDHRGRLHGQAGGFVSKGGDYLTSAAQMRTAARDEHNYFDSRKGKAKSASLLGFRLAIAAPVITSLERLRQLRKEWQQLPELGSHAGKKITEALKALRDVAEKTGDRALRTKLEDVQFDLESALAQINESRDRAAKALIRMGAFTGLKIGIDQLRLDSVKKINKDIRSEVEEFRKETLLQLEKSLKIIQDQSTRKELIEKKKTAIKKAEETIDDVERNLLTLRENLERSLSYYGDLIIDTANDYTAEVISSQRNILRREFLAREMDRLLPFADTFVKHTKAYRVNKEANKQKWLNDILNPGVKSNDQ